MADTSFESFCLVLEELSKRTKSKTHQNRSEQDKILSDFLSEVTYGNVGKKDFNLFPILRLLLPDLERERGAYNLKATKLGLLLVRVLSLSKTSQDAKNLLNFRTVKNSSEGSDFASVAYFVINNRIGASSNRLTIGDINVCLDKVASAEVGNKGVLLDEVFTYVIKNTTAKQAKWFLRIVLKDLKLAIGKTRILSALHPDAPEYYESCTSLLKVCEEFSSHETRPAELGIELFCAVSPMLSERLDVTKLDSLPQPKTYIIENKFDGERFQIHMKDGVFEYYSRKGFTYAEKYGKSFEDGILTPLLKNCFKPAVRNFILDGEMMGWHKQYECFGSKGMSFDVKKITENSRFRPCFCAFDVLYYNDKTLVGPADKGGLPLWRRLEILDEMFVDIRGTMYQSKREVAENTSDIFRALNKAIESQEEGIVVKDMDSYYLANKRNSGWYKIKPEYTEGAMEDLDLVIIGADYAENKKNGIAKSFLVACPECLSEGGPPLRWVSVGRVATGLTFEQRERLCEMLSPHWNTIDKIPPASLYFNKEKPELWVLPEHSVVLTVRATELIRSTDYGAEYTLRFPRVKQIRDDKPVSGATTLRELLALVAGKGPVVKLTSTKRISEQTIDTTAPKRSKRPAKELKVAQQFRSLVDTVEATSKALSDRKICIVSDDDDCSKAELEGIVKSHGGIVVQNNSRTTWCCVVGRMNIHARNVIKSRQADVVSTQWLQSIAPSDQQCPPPSPLDMITISEATRLKLARDFDIHGDSYTEPLDEETLKKCFEKYDRDNEPAIHFTTQELIELDQELFEEGNPFAFLRSAFLYISNPNNILKYRARSYGATISEYDSLNLTHVIICDEDKNRIKEIKAKINLDEVSVVSQDWLETSCEERKMVPVDPYVL